MTLEELWQALEAQPPSRTSGLLRRGAHVGPACAVLAGLSFPGAERVLLLRLPARQAQALIASGLTPAITVTPVEGESAQAGQVTVQLGTREPRHLEMFSHIGDDLVNLLRRDPARPIEALLGRMELWREFLRRTGEVGLTEPLIRGLFGELWFLHQHVLARTTPRDLAAAVAAWTGPLGAARDFTLGQAALDMKTGTPGSTAVEISSISQLTAPADTGLFLGHLILQRSASGQSLPTMVDRVREGLPADARDLLEARLLAAGYLESARESLEGLRLLPGTFNIYAITPDFPALTRGRLPVAVTACTYTLDLAACPGFRVDPQTIPGIGETMRNASGQ